MNIYVCDKNNNPVPGAIVTIYANGKPKVRGVYRGYINSPLKLRFKSDATRIRITVEYNNTVMANKEFMATVRDATICLPEVIMPRPQDPNNKFARENFYAFLFGCLMLLLLFSSPLILPSVLPEYLYRLYDRILLTILALGAAGFAAALTGFILVQIGKEDSNHIIRAGGALAVFVIVFFWNPAGR